jgi:nucleoside-diphosphate-sugar epimerase
MKAAYQFAASETKPLCVEGQLRLTAAMRVLIAGVGYVGLPLGAELARLGHEVLGLRRSSALDDAMQAAGIQPVHGDITRFETLAGLPRQFDWVVNCAATGGGSVADYRRLYAQGTQNLVHWLAEQPPKKFVYTSSTGVYGQDDGSWVDETSVTQPAAETASILVEAEDILRAAVRQNNFPAVILRVAGIYGPNRGHLLKQFLRGEARIEGDGLRHLNMIHRDDLITAVIAALERGRPGEIYNVVDDEPVPQSEFFRWLAARLNRPPPPKASAVEAAARKRGVTNKRISNRKLKAELRCEFRFPNFRRGYESELPA